MLVVFFSVTMVMAKPAYILDGFRSAKFGQSQQQVLQSIRNDFGVFKKSVIKTTHRINKTPMLTVKLTSLEPFSAAATIHYVFGYKSKRLIQVDVFWNVKTKNKQIKNNFIRSSILLSESFQKYDVSNFQKWEGDYENSKLQILSLIQPKSNNALEIVLTNVALKKMNDGSTDIIANFNNNPLELKLTYIYNYKVLDIYKKAL